ncbi:hypothetical protein PINS_up004242 [Pythium insidiosum]|nr:hypothetical protein PINS_up004242 [Pythium insidiosum]
MAEQQGEQQINLMDLSLEQLSSLRTQLEAELKQLTTSFGGLREAQARFQESKDALSHLGDKNLNKQVLVPLTSSMFVPGTLANVQDVLVDIGTGYFVEHKVDDAKAFMDRKITFLESNTEQLKTVLETKRQMLEGRDLRAAGEAQDRRHAGGPAAPAISDDRNSTHKGRVGMAVVMESAQRCGCHREDHIAKTNRERERE